MSWRTSRLAILSRSAARKLGVTRIVADIINTGSYEEAFDAAILGTINKGDVVWDVGANIGHYTLKISSKVGSGGKVYAFEPSPQNRQVLMDSVSGRENIRVIGKALGAIPGGAVLLQSDGQDGANSRLVYGGAVGGYMVEISTVDFVIASGEATPPDVIKIDTEGYEFDVLQGARVYLRNQRLRAVGVEVHFGLLSQRGQASAPSLIEAVLKEAGFNIRWTDASHIVGERN